MRTLTLRFRADQQKLKLLDPVRSIASGTVNYVHAEFDLGENWTEFDVVQTAWSRGIKKAFADLDDHNHCAVPADIIDDLGTVKVNIIGIVIGENGKRIEQLTTFPVVAVAVTGKAMLG